MRMGGSSAQISLKSQFVTVFLRHMFVSALAVVFGLGAFWWLLTQRMTNVLYSCVFICIYFGMMYAKCSRIAGHDLKGYAQTKAYPAKGIVLILPVLAVTLLLDIVRLAVWKAAATERGLESIGALACNTAFILWNFTFNGVMAIERDSVSFAGHTAIYAVPLVSAFLGYFAGYKKFVITEKLLPFIYEKEDESEESG
ncbi:MAG: hypothetical protein J1F64_01690 [Oscillospiraceae bacterium]|nr:hypothetical protein [Oscillospiraceae bacterium]